MEDNNSKEINLLQLITLFLDWLKKLFLSIINAIGQIVKLSFRRKTIFVIVIAISIVVGQYMARKSARIYKAEAMAMIYGSDAQTVKDVSRQLENSLSTNNLISLATKLSLPDSVARNIVQISSYYVIDFMRDSVADIIDFKNNHSLTDTVNVRMRDRVYLRLKTKSIAQVPQVQAALLNYFNNNKVLKSQHETMKNELKQKVEICDSELNRIDSLAQISYFKESDKQLRFSSDKLLLGEQQKQLFYGELLRLQEIKSNAQYKLSNFNQPIEIPADFVVNPLPLNGRFKNGLLSILIGYVLALLIAIFIENYKKIFGYLNN